MGQYAENVYFQKPCGLMDQMASSVGGAVAIDFANPMLPAVHPVAFDFSRTGYVLCIVDTGGNHADLTAEYAAIPAEFRQGRSGGSSVGTGAAFHSGTAESLR